MCLAGTLVTDGTCTTNSTSFACIPISGSETCKYPVLADNTECRAAAGACDVAEVCNSASSGFNCPADGFRLSAAHHLLQPALAAALHAHVSDVVCC
jgi:hypothetical protein